MHEWGKGRFSTKPASHKHCFYIAVLLIQSARLERKRLKSFSCSLFHLHAEIIACFLFSSLLFSHLPADCTHVNHYCLLCKRHSHSNRKFIHPAKSFTTLPFLPCAMSSTDSMNALIRGPIYRFHFYFRDRRTTCLLCLPLVEILIESDLLCIKEHRKGWKMFSVNVVSKYQIGKTHRHLILHVCALTPETHTSFPF